MDTGIDMENTALPRESSLSGKKKKKRARYIALPFIIVGYVLVGILVALIALKSGNFFDGFDTLFYTHRADFLYKSITEEGNWFPIIDMSWYNGVETWRYWSIVPEYILAGCQALAGGDTYNGFLIFSFILYVANGVAWLYIGYKHDRPCLGAIIGAIAFFVPCTSAQMLFSEGVIARAMSMPVIPIFFSRIIDYLETKNWKMLPHIMLCFIWVSLCHAGFAGMLAIATVLYLFLYAVVNLRQKHGSVFAVIISLILSFVILGIYIYPTFFGGIADKDNQSIMATYFQELYYSINPFWTYKYGVKNHWLYSESYYFGLTSTILAVGGAFLSKKDTMPGFAASFIIVLLTTPTARIFLSLLPGGEYLWMLRFMSIAILLLLVCLLYWRTLKKQLLTAVMIAFIVEMSGSVVFVTHQTSIMHPDKYYESLAESMLVTEGKEITAQRMSIADPYDADIDGIYTISGYGDKRVATSFGQGVQAAAAYRNITQLNEAAEDNAYLYMFDRYLQLGNDSVIVPIETPDGDRNELELISAAKKSGYSLVTKNDSYMLFHLDDKLLEDVDKNFGVISKYRGIGIGKSAPTISIDFPMVEETVSWCINDYTYEQLSQYDIVFLAGFTYTDKSAAEEMLIKLSENGTRIIIMADGIPSDENTGSRAFLGLECYPVRFKNGYPELDTIDGYLNCDLFPSGHTDWLTVYVNGLDEVWGTVDDFEQNLPFFGTVKNNNIVVIGLNLSYHYALTKDPTVGALLSYAYKVNTYELPEREIVPLQIDYRNNRIEIVSEYDNVCTTLAWHDIFDADNGAYTKNHLTFVNKGKTVIKLHYPYLWQGIVITVIGLVASVIFILNAKKRWDKENPTDDNHY